MSKVRRHCHRTVFFVVLFALLSLCLFGPALAAEGSQGGDRSGDLWDLLYRFINFALLVIILGWAIKKAGVKDLLAARIEEIRERLDHLKKEKESTESTNQGLDRQLRDFEQEKKSIIEAYKNEGEAEKEKIIAEAQARVKQIIEQAEMTIQQEMRSARNRLKDEIVELAAQKAREIISGKINEQDQDLLVDEFIERVGKIH